MKEVLVYGYYGENAHNLGDQLFKEAFRHLFPSFSFTFVDTLQEKDIKKAALVIFGGGSFLYDPPKMINNVISSLEDKKIFYIGVGVENIHPIHQELMKKAKLIAIRNKGGLEKVSQLNKNVLLIPDLIYALPKKKKPKKGGSILIIPNIEVVPRYTSPHYVHSSWTQFKSEFCQFADDLIESGYKLDFAPMCKVSDLQDKGAIYEIVNMMRHRKYNLIDLPKDMLELTSLFSSYEKVITQRYHGIVLSEIVGTSCLSIAHHDKLKNILLDSSSTISYYGIYKEKLHQEFKKKYQETSINLNTFKKLVDEVLTKS